VLSVAASLEVRSEHPIAEAIVETANEAGVNTDDISAFESLTGKDVRGDLNGETYFAGKPALFEELGLTFDPDCPVSDGGVAVEDAGADDVAASAETIETL
jgi:Cd2+/Zn2+-exporting ATPase